MIVFNKSPLVENSHKYINDALSRKTSGDGIYTKKCATWIESNCNTPRALLTTSCSHALDMAAKLCNIKPGDEIIMSSYTFPSMANAFVAFGAKIVFVDIRPDTMNIDENLIEDAITKNTRVIVPMHYAGVGCEMDCIMDIAKRHELMVVEDAAQSIIATYNSKPLGSFGDYGCLSFHETKNLTMGEGGALLIRNPDIIPVAEIIREKGTNRSRYFRGEVDKYSWVDWGSSYLPSDINAAYLWSQLEIADEIIKRRMQIWNIYNEALSPLVERGFIELPFIPSNCTHNAHMFYLKVNNLDERDQLINHLKSNGVYAVFHYVPLHSSQAGLKFGRFHGIDVHTTKESHRLVRIPLWYDLTDNEVGFVCDRILRYFHVN